MAAQNLGAGGKKTGSGIFGRGGRGGGNEWEKKKKKTIKSQSQPPPTLRERGGEEAEDLARWRCGGKSPMYGTSGRVSLTNKDGEIGDSQLEKEDVCF